MAQKVYIDGGPETAKIRHPVAVPLLGIITFGIYWIYWWYQVNREMADLGRLRRAEGLGDQPFLSLLAVFPGALVIVPPLFSLYNGVQRIKRAQEITVGKVTMEGWIVLGMLVGSLLIGIAWLIVPGYIQNELNQAWQTQARRGPGSRGEFPQEQLPLARSKQTRPG